MLGVINDSVQENTALCDHREGVNIMDIIREEIRIRKRRHSHRKWAKKRVFIAIVTASVCFLVATIINMREYNPAAAIVTAAVLIISSLILIFLIFLFLFRLLTTKRYGKMWKSNDYIYRKKKYPQKQHS